MKYLPSPRSITAYGLYGDDGKPIAIIEFEPSANYIELIRLIASAPALLAALTEGIGLTLSGDFASDLEVIATVLGDEFRVFAGRLEVKAQAIRGAIAAAKGEAT